MSSVCNSCTQKEGYGGCCQVPPFYQQAQFPITLSDAERISKATSKDFEEFLVLEKAGTRFDSVLLSSQITNGLRLRLRLKENGNCVFLSPGEGCTIKSVRPSICKLFPFFPNEEGGVSLLFDKSCLASHQAGKDVDEVLSLLGQSREELLKEVEVFKKSVEDHDKKMKSILTSFTS